ncbi:MAG: reverse transcriptase domain-containing protein, partial [Pirellulaceae bacterium]
MPLSQKNLQSHLARLQSATRPPIPHRILSSSQIKARWDQLTTLPKKTRRTLFRGLWFRVDFSKIDFAAKTREHFVRRRSDLAWAREQLKAYMQSNILVPSSPTASALHHPWFVVRRKGKRRLVVDFDKLNNAVIESPTVSYEDLRTVPDLTAGRRWLLSIDFTSAFHHISLAPSLRPLCSIRVDGQSYHFSVMTFGLSMSPKVWCAALGAAVNHLRLNLGIAISYYMDDLLIAAETAARARSLALFLVRFFQSLGLDINFDKSQLTPMRRLRHLG